MWVCVAVIFFFFFKQKTAYEMRISDWSSDVCSSDLLDQHRDQRRVAEAGDADADQQRAEAGEGIAPESGSHGGGLLGQGKRERRGMLAHAPACFAARRGISAGFLAGQAQIGRAAGRGGGCTEGVVLVGARTIKKKK